MMKDVHLEIDIVGQGYPVVLLHGWGFDHQVWGDFVPALFSDYTLYLVDLPGFGKTSVMDWETFKQQLLARLPEKFAVLGWSLGGMYAIRLACEASNQVTHLIALASSPRCVITSDWPGIQAQVFEGFFTKLLTDPQQTIQNFLRLQAPGNRSPFSAVTHYTMDGLMMGLQILSEWDLRALLHTFPHAGCFIFGRLDAIIPIATLKAMQTAYPQFAYHCIRHAAHIPFRSHTQLVASFVRDCIGTTDNRET